jgi:hypothetical protein
MSMLQTTFLLLDIVGLFALTTIASMILLIATAGEGPVMRRDRRRP